MANFHPIFLLVFVTTIVFFSSPFLFVIPPVVFSVWLLLQFIPRIALLAVPIWECSQQQQQYHIFSWLCLSIDTYLPTGMGLLWLHVADSMQPTGETKQLIFSGVLLVPAVPLYIQSIDGWHGMSRKHWFLFSCTRVQCENVPNLQWQYEKVQIINCTVEDCEENEVAVVFFLYVDWLYIVITATFMFATSILSVE